MSLDAAELAVLIARLTGVAEEMGAVLQRAAYSPNIKERADCSAALFTAEGELLVQAEHIPVHLGSMPASVRAAIDRFGDALAPGDQVILNDPFSGGTHLNDVTLVAPVHVDGNIAAWVANRAHHADLGGMTPGSIPPDAVDIAQEGLRVPPVLLGDDVEALFVASSRVPDERRGDLDAQRGANAVGVNRVRELIGAPFAEVVDYGERRMRAALRALPDGSWTAQDRMDSVSPGGPPGRISVSVEVKGDTITFDFSGSQRQQPGNVNAVRAVTESSVAFALRCATDPTIPANGGALRPVVVTTVPGTIVDAVPPVAVSAGNVEVSQRVADVCATALLGPAPGRVGGGDQGTMNNVLVGGDGWVYYETIGGGQGARPGRGPGRGPGRDGQSGIQTGMTNTMDTPVEALERSYPMRVRRYALRRGSGGGGSARGGDGTAKELEFLEPVTLSLVTERRSSSPPGRAGGEPGAPGENWLLPGGDESRARPLADKCTVELDTGDVLRLLTPGGGGLG